MKEDKKLKFYLVFQSFCPLFVLIFIRHVGNIDLIKRFFSGLLQADWSVIEKAMVNPCLGSVIITFICIVWFIITGIVALGLRSFRKCNFASHGESISIRQEKTNSGITFLMTFILPLLVDDVSSPRGFIFFGVLLIMVILLLIRSDLFYQNPVLVSLGYKTYEFQIVTPYKDVDDNKTYIGLSKDSLPTGEASVKRKYIGDGVFLIENE